MIFKKKKKSNVPPIDLKDVPLVGNHNYQNIMASLISAKIAGISTEKIREAIKEFKAIF